MQTIHSKRLSNGLHLIAQPMQSAKSVAMSMRTPAGITAEPNDQLGISGMLAEMMLRGAGGKSAREHSEALDDLGVQRDVSNQREHMQLSATMLSDHLPNALPLLMDVVLRPNLDAASLEPCRSLALQALDGLQDEPQQRCVEELRRRHLPDPLGRSGYGERASLETMNIEAVHAFAKTQLVPHDAILAFAGQLDWPKLCDQIEQLTQDWQGSAPMPTVQDDAIRGYNHLTCDSAQVHIALAYDALPEPHPQSMHQRIANTILSGGMSGRLFTEIREKRGLVYAVFSQYAAARDYGLVVGYAGTTPQRAQETLDVFVHELERLSQGVRQDEYERALVGMKSGLIMQGESTSARASAIARDQYILGRPRSLDEIAKEVEAVTCEDLNQFVQANVPSTMTIVTLGPEALNPPMA